jgi:hypothetical protein
MGVIYQPDFAKSFDPAWKIVLFSEIDIGFPVNFYLDTVL